MIEEFDPKGEEIACSTVEFEDAVVVFPDMQEVSKGAHGITCHGDYVASMIQSSYNFFEVFSRCSFLANQCGDVGGPSCAFVGWEADCEGAEVEGPTEDEFDFGWFTLGEIFFDRE